MASSGAGYRWHRRRSKKTRADVETDLDLHLRYSRPTHTHTHTFRRARAVSNVNGAGVGVGNRRRFGAAGEPLDHQTTSGGRLFFFPTVKGPDHDYDDDDDDDDDDEVLAGEKGRHRPGSVVEHWRLYSLRFRVDTHGVEERHFQPSGGSLSALEPLPSGPAT